MSLGTVLFFVDQIYGCTHVKASCRALVLKVGAGDPHWFMKDSQGVHNFLSFVTFVESITHHYQKLFIIPFL